MTLTAAELPDWPYAMSASTVAAYLDLGSKSSVYRWVEDGLLPQPHKFRGSARWLRPEIDAALVTHREGEAQSHEADRRLEEWRRSCG